jgi:hypothetical protein
VANATLEIQKSIGRRTKMVKEIAYVKAGNFQAWFEQVDDRYEVQWYDHHSPRAYSFPTKKEAQEIWHEYEIERKNFLHCYCC